MVVAGRMRFRWCGERKSRENEWMRKTARLWVGFNAQGSAGSEQEATVKRDSMPSKKPWVKR